MRSRAAKRGDLPSTFLFLSVHHFTVVFSGTTISFIEGEIHKTREDYSNLAASQENFQQFLAFLRQERQRYWNDDARREAKVLQFQELSFVLENFD